LSVLACGAFIVLKLAGVITWSWWWILLAPAALGAAVLGVVAVGLVILYLRHRWFKRRARRRLRKMLSLQPPFHEFGYRFGYSGFRPGYRVRWRPSAARSGTDATRDDAGGGTAASP